MNRTLAAVVVVVAVVLVCELAVAIVTRRLRRAERELAERRRALDASIAAFCRTVYGTNYSDAAAREARELAAARAAAPPLPPSTRPPH